MNKYLSRVLQFAGAIMILDYAVFMMWVISGQVPVDGFYVGAITASLLKLII